MRKTNLFKSIVCGLMLTTVLGSAVYAGTGSETVAAYKKNVNKSYFGAAGTYVTKGDSEWFILTSRSSSSSSKMYKVEVCEKHYISGQQSDIDGNWAFLRSGGKVEAAILRTWDDPFTIYVSTALTYNSTSESTGIQDNFRCTVEQVD